MTRAWHALAAYVVITFAATWPLGRNLSSNVPWDLGDPLLNMWVLAWDCEQLLAIVRGDFSRIAAFYDANIFYPAPLTLAYAEHLFAQAVQVLPVYAATKNPILCYNLLFLSTFILSGLGMYLLVRELTDSAWGAFAAGLLFAFAPYRMPQGGHLQILSSQWMPFALYGLTRYFSAVARGARHDRALAGGSLALVAQNLSCGYYLLYFMPVAAAYGFWEMLRRRLARQRRVWISLSIALAGVVIVPTRFFLPYGLLRSQFDVARTEGAVKMFSAVVYC